MLSRPPGARGIDINLLPERYRAGPLPWPTIAVWLAVAALLVFTLPLLGFYANARRDIARLEAELKMANKALGEVREPMAEMPALSSTLSQTLSMANQLTKTYETVMAESIDWDSIIDTIVTRTPTSIQLSSVAQAGDTITVQGTGGDEAVVMAYVNNLEMSGLFEEVRLLSAIKTSAILPTPSITVTPSPPLAPPPLTTVDQYEIDDFSPRSILLGEAQLHNFYPPFDADLLTFAAKGGYSYRVSTSQLALGVDTILDVFVAGVTYTNDDRYIGGLSSSVEFQVAAGYDVPVHIRVRNRGQYGFDKTYLVGVEQIGLADPYEIDDTVPKPISIGETQVHNFYPPGDVDKVKLYAKAGHLYTITTSNLAIGVDTYLEVVTQDRITYANDDVGPGNLASVVSFTATSPGVVTVTIANLDRYGPDKTYEMSAWERGYATPTPDPPPSPAATNGATFQPLPGGYGPLPILLGCQEGQILPPSQIGTRDEALSSSARDRYKAMGRAALASRFHQPVAPAPLAPEVQEMVEFVIVLALKR